MKKYLFLLPAIAGIFLFSQCGQTPPKEVETDQLGELVFKYNGSEAAMPFFEKGLKLLHNFEYEKACSAFKQAQELDSVFAMAFWGEAMTYNHPLWREQDYEKGQAALGKLADNPEARQALAQTPLEKDFLRSMEIMYGAEGNKKQRDSLYSEHLKTMYHQYKGDQEVASFYALSLLGAVKVGRDQEAYQRSAQIVQGILDENPNHPGALHYLIHSYDDPDHAPKALPAAFSYAKVAADAAHALHMPSHIFVSVGLWDEVVKSNIASWDASVAWAKSDTSAKNIGSYHALHWLMYGRLQKGDKPEAARIMSDMKKYADEKPTATARGYLITMKGNYLMETDDWGHDIAGYTCDMENLGLIPIASDLWIEGMKAYHKKDLKKLEKTWAEMKAKRQEAAKKVSLEGLPMCSAPGSNRAAPNKSDLEQAEVMELQIGAMLALLKGNQPDAEKLLVRASDWEWEMNYDFGPPTIVKPSFEMLGEHYLSVGKNDLAMAQFDRALQKYPKRRRAIVGMIEASKIANDNAKMQEMEAELKNMSAPLAEGDGRNTGMKKS